LSLDRKQGDRLSVCETLNKLGIAYRDWGKLRRAIKYFRLALVIYREIGDKRGESNMLFNCAVALFKLGQREKAIRQAEAALRICEENQDPNAAKARAKLNEWRGQRSASSATVPQSQ